MSFEVPQSQELNEQQRHAFMDAIMSSMPTTYETIVDLETESAVIESDADFRFGDGRVRLVNGDDVDMANGLFSEHYEVIVFQPEEILPNGYSVISSKIYTVDIDEGVEFTHYNESQATYDAAGKQIYSDIVEQPTETIEDAKRLLQHYSDAFALERSTGNFVFDQQKYEEVMAILRQISPTDLLD